MENATRLVGGAVVCLLATACHLHANADIPTCEGTPLGCGGGDDTSTPETDDTGDTASPPVDDDGDGYTDDVDCDDGDPEVNPDAVEVCDDGVDNDCDGTTNGCGLEGRVRASSGTLTLVGDASGNQLAPATVLGDVDGDGTPDLALGAPGYDAAGTEDRGRVWIVPGDSEAQSVAEQVATSLAAGTEARTGLGKAVTGGDYDGDGLADLVTTGVDGSMGGYGAAWFFAGPPEGGWQTSGSSLRVDGDGGDFGSGLLTADLDGDGAAELIVGAPNDQGGTVYIWAGASLTNASGTSDALALRARSTGSGLGWNLDPVGDLDGDGIDDLALGSPWEGDGGTVWVLTSTTPSSLDDAEVELTGKASGDGLGFNVAGGDVDGDGHDDLVVASLAADTSGFGDSGEVYVLAGPLDAGTSLADAIAIYQGADDEQYFGEDLAAGDLNGDGVADLVVGAVGDADSASNAGAVYVAYAPLSGTTYAEDLPYKVVGDSTDDQLGWPVAVGDADGDGIGDMLLSAKEAGDQAGAFYLRLGESAF